MSWNPNQGQDPNQPGVYSGQPGQYSAPVPPPTNDPYSGGQGGYQQQQGGYQQPPYQQAPYQQPPVYGQQQYGGYQQPYGAASSANGPTSMGMQANTAAGLSYIAGWITGLIFFFGEKQNRFVRFNAMQSILLYAAVTVIYIILGVLGGALLFSGLYGIVILLNSLVGIGAFVLWLILMINAFQGKYIKLPIVGDYAEKFATPTMPTM
jgi:uncharacterized membrane protein